MSRVVRFELIQRHEELFEEMAQLQEEIDILNLLLKKVRDEYSKIDYEIKKSSWSNSVKTVNVSKAHT